MVYITVISFDHCFDSDSSSLQRCNSNQEILFSPIKTLFVLAFVKKKAAAFFFLTNFQGMSRFTWHKQRSCSNWVCKRGVCSKVAGELLYKPDTEKCSSVEGKEGFKEQFMWGVLYTLEKMPTRSRADPRTAEQTWNTAKKQSIT